jgi:hypothetical protein
MASSLEDLHTRPITIALLLTQVELGDRSLELMSDFRQLAA